MAAPTKARQQSEVDPYLQMAQEGIDSAPSLGKRGTYIKAPNGIPFFAPVQGRTYRLLFLAFLNSKNCPPPRVAGSHSLLMQLWTHAAIGPNAATYLCAQQMYGQRCAVDDEFMRLKTPRMPREEWDAIAGMKPKSREVRLVHDLDGEKDNIQIWEESYHLFGVHFVALIGNRPAYKLYAHPQRGMIVEVTGKKKAVGQGECTDFATIVMTPFSKEAGCEAIPTKLIERAKKICLDDCLVKPPEYKTLMCLTRGMAMADANGQPNAHDDHPAEEGETITEETEATAEEEVVEKETVTEEVTEETATEEVIEEEEPAVEEEVIEEEVIEEVIEEEEAAPSIEVGSVVTFIGKDKKKAKGEVTEIDGDKAKVKVGKSVFKLGLDKLTLVA